MHRFLFLVTSECVCVSMCVLLQAVPVVLILSAALISLTTRVGSFAFPAVWVESFLFVCEGFGLHCERPSLLTSHFLPSLPEEDADRSVVLARVHLCVLHPELLGKQHEGVHWPLALLGRDVITSCWAGLLGFGWLLTRRVGVTWTVAVL